MPPLTPAKRPRTWLLLPFTANLLVTTSKLELHNLRGLFRRGHELPFLDRVLTGLNEQRMATDDSGALHAALCRDHHFDFHFARDVHPLGQFRVSRRYLGLDLAFAFVGRAGLREDRSA